MSMGKVRNKRKRDPSPGEIEEQSEKCIIHKDSIDDHGPFTPFSKIKANPTEKLRDLHIIRDKRLAETPTSPNRQTDICNLIPESLENINLSTHGYHRQCYASFTKNLSRLTAYKTLNEASTSKKHRSPRKKKKLETSFLFPIECIFCESKIKKISRNVIHKLFKFASYENSTSPWESIEAKALELGDDRLYRQVQGQNLFAVEAWHHKECFNKFKLLHSNHIRSKEIKEKKIHNTDQACMAAAHEEAFNAVLEDINEDIIKNNKIVKLSSLKLTYINKLEEKGYPNPDYRSETLKSHLQIHEINESICFTKINPSDEGARTYYLIYNKQTTVADAVAVAYELGSCDKFSNVALDMRKLILEAFKKSEKLPWPPTHSDMEMDSRKLLPSKLVEFLNLVLAGTYDADEKSLKTKRLVFSIGQDLCRAITNEQWKLPKHILICNALRHLYRSKQLTTILYRLGHSESYDFGLELETAIADAISKVSTFLTPQIITGEGNDLIHFEWDNLNKNLTTIHAPNFVNSTGGIMIQEKKSGFKQSQARILPEFDRSGKRSFKANINEIPDEVTITCRNGPKFPLDASFITPTELDTVYDTSMQEYYLWLFCRKIGSEDNTPVPAHGGFISSTGVPPISVSTIDFFPTINHPITDYSTVKELLRHSEEVTAQVAGENGQQYVVNTFDLGACMKVLPFIWKYPDTYRSHIVLPGAFHTIMNFIGVIGGHKLRGSGYSEILLEAQLISSGTLKSVLSGKAYNKALFCLQTVCEAMERLLIEQFILDENIENYKPEACFSLINSCTRENLQLALKDKSTLDLLKKYKEYEDKVYNGHLGKTPQYWCSVIRNYHLSSMLLFAVKTNNLKLFHKCCGSMSDIFFVFDCPNYSRYLLYCELFLTNLELTHPGGKKLLEKGAISVARSLIPSARSAVDKTMEETFMKSVKSKGGLSGIFTTFGAEERWVRTSSSRALLYEKLLDIVDLIDDPDIPKAGKHRELQAYHMRKSEEAVLRTQNVIKDFINPWTITDKENLYCISSGVPCPKNVEADLLNAETKGKHIKETFIKERFQNEPGETKPKKEFFDPIKKTKLLTMEANNKVVKLTSTQGKVIQYQEQSNIAFTLLVKSQLLEKPIDLEKLVCYPLTPVPHMLGTPDGFFAKTNKASMLHYLLEEFSEDVRIPENAFHIQDGNAHFYTLTKLPDSFGMLCLQILGNMARNKNFIFSTDSYEDFSIKSQERLRRGNNESAKQIVDKPSIKTPLDIKFFFSNEDNKKQFCKLLKDVWSNEDAAPTLKKCEIVIIVIEGTAYQLLESNGKVNIQEIHELKSNQEETDSRVVLYLNYADKLNFSSAVVKSPDTDIFFILLYHIHWINLTVYLDIGTGKHRRIINITEFGKSLGKDYCNTLLGYYVFSGEDCTSAFKGKGKVTPLKKLQRNPKFNTTFSALGEDWNIGDNVQNELEEFTCIMYGDPREKSVNKLRGKMLQKMVGGKNVKLTKKSKIDLSRIPPCANSLKPHIERVNHRLNCYKKAHMPIFHKPNPFDNHQGWEKSDNGFLEPIWSYGDILPPSLIDILERPISDNEESDVDDMDDLLDYLDEDLFSI